MFKNGATIAAIAFSTLADAYAAAAPAAEERGFPLALVFALIAVFISVGVVIIAARSKKND